MRLSPIISLFPEAVFHEDGLRPIVWLGGGVGWGQGSLLCAYSTDAGTESQGWMVCPRAQNHTEVSDEKRTYITQPAGLGAVLCRRGSALCNQAGTDLFL